MILRPRAKRVIFVFKQSGKAEFMNNKPAFADNAECEKSLFAEVSFRLFRKFIVMRYSRCAGGKFLYNPRAAGVAQLVEQLICNQ